MENFEYIEELIRTKDYENLSQSERSIIDVQIGEQRYVELRLGILAVQGERISMNKEKKKELLREWQPKRSGVATFLLKPLPTYSYLLVFILFGFIYWFTPPKVVTKTQIAEVEVPIFVRDTITLVKLDTLWRERVVMIPTPLVVQNDQQDQPVPVIKISEAKALSEQEDLLDLVVRGK